MASVPRWGVRAGAGLGLLAIAAFPLSRMQVVAASPQAVQSSPLPAKAPGATALTPERVLLNKYCVTCHSDRLKTAGLSLQGLNVEHVAADAEVWEKVVRKLRGAVMPPAGAPRPEKRAIDSLVSFLETALDRAAATAPNPGWTAVHRLNRAEYANAIRDVLSLEVDVYALLPVDDAAYGFDNIASLLSMSPGLLDRYLSAARKISGIAIADATMSLTSDAYDVSKFLVQDYDRMSEELPFGSVGGIAIRHYFPLDAEYVAKIVVSGRNEVDVRLDGIRVALVKPAPGLLNQSQAPAQELRFAAKAGMRVVGFSFPERTTAPEGVGPARTGGYGRLNTGVNRVEIVGPYNATGFADTPVRQQIFVCRPASSRDEESCARKIFAKLARRAYRRPVSEDDVNTLLAFYTAGRAAGDSFDGGIRRALVRILVSPDFLFRIERDPNVAASVHRVSDVELASRLSFFIWSSVPDEELLQVAESGHLHDPAVLDRQVRRMLKDARASALVSNFAAQWLYLRNLRAAAPDAAQFPDFDDNLRDAMRRETELFVESQVHDDRPLTDLLRADYTFLNERLARHYDIPNIYGSAFRRVTMTDDRRTGLLGQASILTVTSYSHRTSVVQRGKWILENMLGAAPPGPPADIPPLEENVGTARPKSVRERMEQHRKNPSCSVCHAQMDPVGFALENFDAVGAWRATDAGAPIDASGALPDGTTLNGPADLRQAILGRHEQFVATVTEKMLTYALGRGVEYYDQPALRQILRGAAPRDYRWSALILGIVKSQPFQRRLAPGDPGAPAVSQKRAQQ